MRNITFRGKTLKQQGMMFAGDWVEGGYYMDDSYGGNPKGKHYIVAFNSSGMGYFQHIEVDIASVGQFIGSVDKNKSRIFEGNLIRNTDGQEFQVVWDEMGWAIENQTSLYIGWVPERCEIIGNVCEQKEGISYDKNR